MLIIFKLHITNQPIQDFSETLSVLHHFRKRLV